MSNHVSEQGQEEQKRVRNFNPNDHVMQLKSKQGAQDYLPVQWRLVWFRQECPEGTIETEIVHLDLDKDTEEETYVWNNEKRRSEKVVKTAKGVAIFRATVKDGKGGSATGTKMEKAASFPDFLEKAETGSIGRALAALGYGTQFAPELSEAHRIVDSPVDRGTNGYESNNSNGNASFTPMRPTAINNNTNGNGSSPVATPSSATGETPTDASMLVTEQQVSSIRKLTEYLGKAEPEGLESMSNLEAKKVIQQLTAEYRQSKKAS